MDSVFKVTARIKDADLEGEDGEKAKLLLEGEGDAWAGGRNQKIAMKVVLECDRGAVKDFKLGEFFEIVLKHDPNKP